MKEQVYHIVITKYCDHDCLLCCNKFYDLDRLPTVTGDNLREANTVCLTGGEPFVLQPDTISGLSKALKEQYPNIQRIYVYTSGLRLGDFVGKEIGYMYRFIDGINVAPKSIKEWRSFVEFIKKDIWRFMPDRFASSSNRLYVFPEQQGNWDSVRKEYCIHLDSIWKVIGRKWDNTFNTPDNEHFVRLPILF